MWVFLISEIMFFGGLFLCFVVYRYLYIDAFFAAGAHLDVKLGAINTVILIGSSFTMVLAVNAVQTGRTRLLIFFLLVTAALGLAFLGIKSIEYSHKFHDHLVPGPHFGHPPTQAIFYSLYFCMTGLHALHMIIGLGYVLFLVFRARTHAHTQSFHDAVENMGLYWHFVDVVWVFLFPVLYLINRGTP
jgi:cytochrome c oxidase subunit 3